MAVISEAYSESACSLTPTLLPFLDVAGKCDACGKDLTGRQKRWCSTDCSLAIWRQHDWNGARKAAKKRDGYRCVQCGKGDDVDHLLRSRLEVNHIEPRVGRGYGFGCWNHLDNLETLCHDCHVIVTKAQAAERRREFREKAQAREDTLNGTEPLFP